MICSSCHCSRPQCEFDMSGKTCRLCRQNRAKRLLEPFMVAGCTEPMQRCKRCQAVKPEADFVGEFRRCSSCAACRAVANSGQPRRNQVAKVREALGVADPDLNEFPIGKPVPLSKLKGGCVKCGRAWAIPAGFGCCGVTCDAPTPVEVITVSYIDVKAAPTGLGATG